MSVRAGQRVYQNSLCLPLNFAVDKELVLILSLIKEKQLREDVNVGVIRASVLGLTHSSP